VSNLFATCITTAALVLSSAAFGASGVAANVAASAATLSTTFQHVTSVGKLTCGVVAAPEDWTKEDLHGPLTALDGEICRAVGVAVLGPAAKVQLERFASELEAKEAVAKGRVDLAVGLTPDATSTWRWNLGFGPPVFYDGQSVMVRGDSTAKSIADLAGYKVCMIQGTDNDRILQARTVAKGIAVHPLPFQEEGEMNDGFAVGHCDAESAYLSRLAGVRVAYLRQMSHARILPDMLTLDPIAPAYRRDDAQWARIVDWTVHALVQAEASGITQSNVTKQGDNEDVVVQRLLGVDWATSLALGLPARDWAAQVIAATGNYGEIYDRTVGKPMQLPRGLNALWTNGGLLHPLPVQ